MRTKLNFCGIFATTFLATTIALISSCSQDDDFYDSDMYTLAEEMTTRSGGEPGGDDWGYQPQANECGIWCLVHLKGGYLTAGKILGIINRNNIDISNGLQQKDMILISDSIGLGLSYYMNDTYATKSSDTGHDTIITEKGRALQKILTFTRGKSGSLPTMIIQIPSHSVVGKSVSISESRIYVADVNGRTYISFNDVTGVVW
ncbi:MAG: hypothetical protein IJ693_00495 [Bacteroidaceae bacterium]|nr:hypothetical protein [Bacteroidaceae bacterium]